MAKTQTYSMEKVLAAREALRQLPVKEKEKSRAEVVDLLKPDFRKAVKQGPSLKEIQAILAGQGVNVSLSRMEAVLGRSEKELARKKTDSCQPSSKAQKVKPEADAPENETVKPETRKPIPVQKTEPANMPSYYTPDLPDTEL
jgi:hypothetical protein